MHIQLFFARTKTIYINTIKSFSDLMRNEVIKDFYKQMPPLLVCCFQTIFIGELKKNACASKIHSIIVFSESNCQFENIFGSITWDYRYFSIFCRFKTNAKLAHRSIQYTQTNKHTFDLAFDSNNW